MAHVPTEGENTVAEHIFGLLLTISHKLDQAIDRTRKGSFSPRGLQGFDPEGRTLGVIGTGNIGRHTIRIAQGFALEVLAYDVKRDDEAARTLDFRYMEMDELLRSVYQRKHNLDALLADHVRIRLRSVVVTPHIAFNTREAVTRILDTTVENIEGFPADKPRNVVGGFAGASSTAGRRAGRASNAWGCVLG